MLGGLLLKALLVILRSFLRILPEKFKNFSSRTAQAFLLRWSVFCLDVSMEPITAKEGKGSFIHVTCSDYELTSLKDEREKKGLCKCLNRDTESIKNM